MFSLSSVAGTPAQVGAHRQTTRNGSSGAPARDKPDELPVQNAQQAAERVLRAAVESIEFRETQSNILESEEDRSENTDTTYQGFTERIDRFEDARGQGLDVLA